MMGTHGQGATKRPLHQCTASAAGNPGLSEQQLRDERNVLFALLRSVALSHRQILRAPGPGLLVGRSMAERDSGNYSCTVCGHVLWREAPGFAPLHFMQCGNDLF